MHIWIFDKKITLRSVRVYTVQHTCKAFNPYILEFRLILAFSNVCPCLLKVMWFCWILNYKINILDKDNGLKSLQYTKVFINF